MNSERATENCGVNSGDNSRDSVQSMMRSVETRFDDDKPGTFKDHFKVKSSAIPSRLFGAQKTARRVEELNAFSQNSLNSKQKSISSKTKEMLVKSRAQGNPNTPMEDRVFFSVHFRTAQQSTRSREKDLPQLFLFFSRHWTLGEMLQQLWTEQAQIATHMRHIDFPSHGTSSPQRGTGSFGFVLSTSDTVDWREWDRRRLLGELFSTCEDVEIWVQPLHTIRETQKIWEDRDAKASTGKLIENDALTEAENSTKKFEKEEFVWYHKNGRNSKNELQCVLVKVVEVHLDDFPNLYYTIQLQRPVQTQGIDGPECAAVVDKLVFQEEKQTDVQHLLPLSPLLPKSAGSVPSSKGKGLSTDRDNKTQKSPSFSREEQFNECLSTLAKKGPPVTIKISRSGMTDKAIAVGSDTSVGQLQQLMSLHTGVPVSDMKLICRGLVLKDKNMLLRQTKVADGSKVFVMGGVMAV